MNIVAIYFLDKKPWQSSQNIMVLYFLDETLAKPTSLWDVNNTSHTYLHLGLLLKSFKKKFKFFYNFKNIIMSRFM
jgi:hypothetical protein